MILFSLSVLPGTLAVCRLEADAPVPSGITELPFVSITRTQDELSLVVPEDHIPPGCRVEKGWRVLKLQGPIDFNLTGVLASLSGTLARARLSIFAISTYDTDYILVKESDLPNAVAALRKEGHRIDG